MKVQLAIFALCSLLSVTTLLPSLADPDSDLPLHLQPLSEKSAAIGMKHTKAKHVSKKSHAKHSLFVSMEFHGTIDSPSNNAR